MLPGSRASRPSVPLAALLVAAFASACSSGGGGTSTGTASGGATSSGQGTGSSSSASGGAGGTGSGGTASTGAGTASTGAGTASSTTSGAGGAGGGLVDTCPVPAGSFAVEAVPAPGPDTDRRRVVIQVPTNGPVGLYSVDSYQNGSFYDELLKRFEKNQGSWTYQTVADEEWGLSVASALASSDGDDPCIVYNKDYDGVMRLACTSITDRVIAPGTASGVAIAAFGNTKHVARIAQASDVEWLTTDGGTPTVPETIDSGADSSAISMAVDAQGTPHVAWVKNTYLSPGQYLVEVRYAKRQGGAWSPVTVDSEMVAGAADERLAVSLALDPAGHPSIAYHHRSTRSLRIVVGDGTSFSAPVPLDVPQPGYPSDDDGKSVALAIDCFGRKRVVYSRNVTTDPTPSSRLAFALVGPTGLTDRVMLPLLTSYYPGDFDLSYRVDAAGHDHIGVVAGALQYVTR